MLFGQLTSAHDWGHTSNSSNLTFIGVLINEKKRRRQTEEGHWLTKILSLTQTKNYFHPEFICYRIERITESGLLKHWKKKHWPPDLCAAKMEKMKTASRALTLDDIRAVFLILCTGLSLATICLICEYIAKYSNFCLNCAGKRTLKMKNVKNPSH